MKRRHLLAASLALACVAPTASAQATRFPTKAVTLVVPNAPGGAVDILSRLMEKQLA